LHAELWSNSGQVLAVNNLHVEQPHQWLYIGHELTGLVPRWYVFASIIWQPSASNWSGRRPFSVPWKHIPTYSWM